MIYQNNLILKEESTKENRIWVRIAAACNEKCLFCLDSDAQDGRLIPENIVKKQIREGWKVGYKNRVILSGGEATINPKFGEYIRYAKEIWYDRIQTVTNGNMFALPSFCDKVIALWLQEVTFSLHGHTASLHDYLTATPGSFKKAITWLIYLRKHHPNVIINIDIVVNKINVSFLPKIVQFFMWLWVHEFDILQIIPFGRWFSEYKNRLFYDIEDYLAPLHATWKLARMPGVYIWTNRFPVEAFEWYEDLIQDPRKIKSETLGESFEMFDPFIRSRWEKKPECYGEACSVCFLNQYCHDFLNSIDTPVTSRGNSYTIKSVENWINLENAEYIVLEWEEFPSQIYSKYGNNSEEFISYLRNLPLLASQKLINISPCIREENNHMLYQNYNDLRTELSVQDYTQNYIKNLYRKKSISCKKCKYNDHCKWIHINFIRAYGFKILNPIPK